MLDTMDALFFMDKYKKEITAGVIALFVGYQLISDLYFTNDKETSKAKSQENK
ncbi:hypothetical protein HZA97_10085 [Candidatus Woesearchaeota archaeon]|nr:hypothetical protein [Candidatus Woesearchaeota archaeon]